MLHYIAFAVFIRGLSSVLVVLSDDIFRFLMATLGFQRDWKSYLLGFGFIRVGEKVYYGYGLVVLLMVCLTWSKVF